MWDEIRIPGKVWPWNARRAVRDVVRKVLDAIGDIPGRQDTRTDQCARLHDDDDWPPASLQQRRVRDCTRSKLDDHADGDLARGPDVPLVHRMAVGFQPQRKNTSYQIRLCEKKDVCRPYCRDCRKWAAAVKRDGEQ